jgi:hypothetical protein
MYIHRPSARPSARLSIWNDLPQEIVQKKETKELSNIAG